MPPRISLQTLNQRLEQIETLAKEHDKILVRGTNGIPSLLEEVRSLQKSWDSFLYWARAIALVVIAQIIIFWGGVVVVLVQSLPYLRQMVR